VRPAASHDPQAFAATSGIERRQGSVLIGTTLAGAGDPPLAYGVVVEARYADLMQAWVPVHQLCALSSDPNVVAIRSAMPGLPNTLPRSP
jgi:hypothetical protein